MNESFAFYITTLKKQFTQYCTKRLLEMDVTYGQLFVIIYIGKKESCSPKEISMALNLDAGHLNRTLAKLIENGIIVQKKNINDKRANIVNLTDKGKEIFEFSRNLFYDWDNVLLEGLDISEKEQLNILIKKITTNYMKKIKEMD